MMRHKAHLEAETGRDAPAVKATQGIQYLRETMNLIFLRRNAVNKESSMWWCVRKVPEVEATPKTAEELIALAEKRLNDYNLLSEDKQGVILTPRQQETLLITSAIPSTAIYIHKFIQHYATHEGVAYEDARTKIVSHIEKFLRRRRASDSFHPIYKPVKILCLCGRVFGVRLEGRKWDRKRTRLPGMFIDSSCVPEGTSVTVEDLSRGGYDSAHTPPLPSRWMTC
jgi:hypothetical protein